MSIVPYAFVIGSLMYAMVCIRPYIAHVVGTFSQIIFQTQIESMEC